MQRRRQWTFLSRACFRVCAILLALLLVVIHASHYKALVWRSTAEDAYKGEFRFGISRGSIHAVVNWWSHGFELAMATGSYAASNPLTGWRLKSASTNITGMLWPNREPSWGGESFLLPLWIPAVVALFGILATLFVPGRAARGRCACDYDLTGNVSGRCPECGLPASDPDDGKGLDR